MKFVILNSAEPSDAAANSLIKAMISGFNDRGIHTCDHIILTDALLKECDDCGDCYNRSIGKCTRHNEAAEVLETVAQTDYIIMVTHVKDANISVKLRNLLKIFELSSEVEADKDGNALLLYGPYVNNEDLDSISEHYIEKCEVIDFRIQNVFRVPIDSKGAINKPKDYLENVYQQCFNYE